LVCDIIIFNNLLYWCSSW